MRPHRTAPETGRCGFVSDSDTNKGKAMKTYTVRVEYHTTYYRDEVVQAESVEAACDAAIETAGDNPSWRSYDDVSESYIGAVVEGVCDNPYFPDDQGETQQIPKGYSDAEVLGFRE